jgi:hypothetical protein
VRVALHPQAVPERSGHRSVACTLDTSSHVMPSMQPDAAERFAEMAFGTSVSGHQPDHDADDRAQPIPGRPSDGRS